MIEKLTYRLDGERGTRCEMGKTYRERIEAIMAEYHKVLDKARAEFMHYGEVKDDTDARLTALEDKLAAAMM